MRHERIKSISLKLHLFRRFEAVFGANAAARRRNKWSSVRISRVSSRSKEEKLPGCRVLIPSSLPPVRSPRLLQPSAPTTATPNKAQLFFSIVSYSLPIVLLIFFPILRTATSPVLTPPLLSATAAPPAFADHARASSIARTHLMQEQVNSIALIALNTFGTLQRDAPPVRLSPNYPEPPANPTETINTTEQPKEMSAALVQAAKKVCIKIFEVFFI
ncbi:Mediator of RNA polymerase II transcription subunit 21 [Platanthera guangdongensis]|uniref:Mediator of RNA polymerase II transcription subunit 21 n=1 Tax=Platanthera guangdongensis TaxID=2320717 RepID=A0ABR2M4W1_9ASPA